MKNTVLERTTVSGINALRAIFGLEREKDEELVGDIIKGKSFLRRYKYFDVPLEERTPYSMLIAYNRYQHYPKDSRGFFYDAADCFMYGHMFRSLNEPEEFLGYDRDAVARFCSKYHGLLDNLPASARFRDIAVTIEESDQRIKDAIAQVYGSIRFMALYFYAKERILADETVSLSGIRLLLHIQKEYPAEFPRLVTLLGGFLGYTWVYDRFYEFKGCPFLSVRHSLDDFQPTEPAAQTEPVPVSSEETHTTDAPSLEEGQEANTTQSDAPSLSSPSPEVQPKVQNPVTTEESQEAVPEIHQEEANQTDPEAETLQPNTAQPPVECPEPALDVPNIIRVVCKRWGDARKSAFEARLKEHYDTVLLLSREKDVDGLRGIYLRLDQQYDSKNKNDRDRIENFVKTCTVLVYSMN